MFYSIIYKPAVKEKLEILPERGSTEAVDEEVNRIVAVVEKYNDWKQIIPYAREVIACSRQHNNYCVRQHGYQGYHRHSDERDAHLPGAIISPLLGAGHAPPPPVSQDY